METRRPRNTGDRRPARSRNIEPPLGGQRSSARPEGSSGRRTSSSSGTARRRSSAQTGSSAARRSSSAGKGGSAPVRKKKKKQKKQKFSPRFFVIIAVVVLLLIFGLVKCVGGAGNGSKDKTGAIENAEPVKSSQKEITLLCVGDIMAHSVNIKSAANGDGTYDFNENYEFVTPYIEKADLALCNVETTYAGGTPSGYPLFNAPDSMADAIKNAGFDVAITSNNHMMDTGYDGMIRTQEILKNAGLEVVGSRSSVDAKPYLVTEANGVKVGIVSYTYETTETAGAAPTINGNYVSDEAAQLINSFNYAELDTEDYDKIQADIDGAKADGAEVIVCYFHWGNEYEKAPNSRQTAMAQEIAERGADVIFASHPHVLQEASVVETSSGKKVPVYYSLGNFISNQRDETLQNRFTENGAIAMVRIVVDSRKGAAADTAQVIPTWVDKYDEGGTIEYRIIPLDDALSSNSALAVSGHLSRAQQAYQDAVEMFGDFLNGAGVQSFNLTDPNAPPAPQDENKEEGQ